MMRIGGSVRAVKRCFWCRRLIWPWQARWVLYALPVPSERHYHNPVCWRAYLQQQQERQWRQEQEL